MSNTYQNRIPLVILIFFQNGQFSYRAYSPTSYQPIGGSVHPQEEEQYIQFMARVDAHIGRNVANNETSQTNYGDLREIHTRFIEPNGGTNVSPWSETPIAFFTSPNMYCNYGVVHRNSPIFFDNELAHQHALAHPELTPVYTACEFV